MAIELPDQVVQLLDFIGINWPEINEDKVREFADHVRDFANKVDDNHQDATATVKKLADSWEGVSYDILVAKWQKLSADHMDELVAGCHTVAGALDVAADTIVAMKGVAIGELVTLAVSFFADQAAAVVTFGIAEAAEAGIVAAAKAAVKYLEDQLEQHIMSAVIEAAVTPLLGLVQKAVGGLAFEAVEAAVGGAGAGGAGAKFSIDPEIIQARAKIFHGHADAIESHAADFHAKASGMSFA